MESLRRFRLMVVRISLLITASGGFGAYMLDPDVGKGVLIGGIAGVLMFWVIARSTEKLASLPAKKVRFRMYTWSLGRLVVYGLVLVRAYTWDPKTFHGFWGAVGGILIVQVVTMFMGLTGLDLKEEK